MFFYKKTVALFSVVFVFFASCSKFSKAKDSSVNYIEENSEYKRKSAIVYDIYEKMSSRFKEEISFDENKMVAFLQDLEEILLEEKTFNKDDVSLFYLIDKKHNIGSEYVPKNLVSLKKNDTFNINRNDLSLRPEAYDSLLKMAIAAKKDNITLLVSSTYRSYEYQKNLFEKWVRIDGLEEAERESARAGTSQHQLGVAVDFGSIDDSFADTDMGKWMYENAHDYGWSLSFPKNYEDVTGYRWESWHFRYIGKKAVLFQKKWFNNVQQYMLEFLAQIKQRNFI